MHMQAKGQQEKLTFVWKFAEYNGRKPGTKSSTRENMVVMNYEVAGHECVHG